MDLIMTNTHHALTAASRGPASEIHAGKAPLPLTITLPPPQPSSSSAAAAADDEVKQLYAHLEAASSIACLQTTIFNEDFRVGRGQAQHYDMSVEAEAALAFADIAVAGLRAMEGPLSLFYSRVGSEERGLRRSMRRGEVHGAFLGEVFGGYGLGGLAMGRLDGILTAFVAAVRNVGVDVWQGGTVDFTVRINRVVRREVLGGGGERISVYQPCTRIVCLKIDPSAYKWAIDKDTDETGTFQMRYTTHDFDLDVGRFLASKERFDAVFQGLLGEDTASYARRTNHVLVSE